MVRIIHLTAWKCFSTAPSGNKTYSITNAVNGQAHSFTLMINQTATVRTLTFPASVKWQGGEIPDLTTASKTLCINLYDSRWGYYLVRYVGGGEF